MRDPVGNHITLGYREPIGAGIEGSQPRKPQVAIVPIDGGLAVYDYDRGRVTLVPDPDGSLMMLHRSRLLGAQEEAKGSAGDAALIEAGRQAELEIQRRADSGIERDIADAPTKDVLEGDIRALAEHDGTYGAARQNLGSFLSQIPFGSLGSVFGSNLSRLIDVENPLAALAVGTTIGVIGLNLGQQIEREFDGSASLTVAFKDFPQDLAAAGVGALGRRTRRLDGCLSRRDSARGRRVNFPDSGATGARSYYG